MSEKDDHRVFVGSGEKRGPMPSMPSESGRLQDPAFYIADEGLRQAVDVALLLGKPLLITGEPGTGKTQLAYRVAYEFSQGEPPEQPLIFHTKTTSVATDLFYSYDNLRHFQDVQLKKPDIHVRDYIRYQALGIAIMRADPRPQVRKLLPPEYACEAPRRSVVLIDELDKAPRDLPNDILNEIEDLEFSVKELEEELKSAEIKPPFRAGKTFSPVLILTSNSERDLPDAFLRRCIFYYIPFPDKARLIEILQKRLKLATFTPLMLENAVVRFEEIRAGVKKKKPSTEELIAWVRILDELGIDPKNPKPGQVETLAFTYSALTKGKEDFLELQPKR
jgi:MoxR-like ATPase